MFQDEDRAKYVLENGYEYNLGHAAEGWKRGARILLHPANTYPEVATQGSDISAGMVHDVQVWTVHRMSLEPPWGRCDKNIDTHNYTIEVKSK